MNRSCFASSSLALLATLALAGCGGDDNKGPSNPSPSPTATPTPTPTPATLRFDFAADGANWTAGFADYGQAQAGLINFVSGVRQLPAPLADRTGYFLGGNNRSDDLAMFIYRPIEGLDPARSYRVESRVTIASNVPPGCIGIGGSPGESVFIKAGAAPRTPEVALNASGLFEVNVNKGQQAQSGSEAVVIGDFAAAGASACSNGTYVTEVLAPAANSPVVQPDGAGRLWLFLTTDSGFEGRTEIYFLNAEFTLVPR